MLQGVQLANHLLDPRQRLKAKPSLMVNSFHLICHCVMVNKQFFFGTCFQMPHSRFGMSNSQNKGRLLWGTHIFQAVALRLGDLETNELQGLNDVSQEDVIAFVGGPR